MNVYLVHHSEALSPHVDPQRPLSNAGRAQAEWLADYAKSRQVAPGVIWHSGKLRARQTGEAFLRICNPFATFKLVRGLLPEDPTMWMENALSMEENDVLAVGHMPNLPAVARALGAVDPLPTNGMIAFERQDDGSYIESWRAQPSSPPIR